MCALPICAERATFSEPTMDLHDPDGCGNAVCYLEHTAFRSGSFIPREKGGRLQ